MKRIIRPLDYLVFLFSIALVVGASVHASNAGGTPKLVQIDAEGETLVFPLEEDRQVDVEGPLGHSHIKIQDGKVMFVDSPCPEKICVATGWIGRSNQWAACLPNRIFVTVIGEQDESDPDATTF